MKKTYLLIALIFRMFYVYAQLGAGKWMAAGEYVPGSSISLQMKQMAAEKKLVFKISDSGSVSGNLITRYNTARALIPQEGGAEQNFTLSGKFEPSNQTLLLVLTHLNNRPNSSESLLTFAKPDSLYYDLKPIEVSGKKQSVLKAIARNPEKNSPLEECVGSPFYGGLGMHKSDHKNAHLLPLLISFDKKGIVQKPTLIQHPDLPERPYTANLDPRNGNISHSSTSPVSVSLPKTALVRKTRVQKTILLDNPNITIALYDNGEIDGDVATLLLDGKIIIDKHPLSTQPAIISLLLSNGKEEHILEMFADNLGSIPPNTALVVLTCNQKRYEINLSSSEKINEGVKLIVK